MPAVKPKTTVFVKVEFKHDWGGTGNILQLLEKIRKIAGVAEVELESVELEEGSA